MSAGQMLWPIDSMEPQGLTDCPLHHISPHIWFLLSHFNTRQRVEQSPKVKVVWCVQGVLIVLLCALNLMREWINPIHISNVYAELFFLWPNALIQYLLSTVCQTSTHQIILSACECWGGGHIAKMTKCFRFVCIILVQFTLYCCLQSWFKIHHLIVYIQLHNINTICPGSDSEPTFWSPIVEMLTVVINNDL